MGKMSGLFFDRFRKDSVRDLEDKNNDAELALVIKEINRLLNTKCARPEYLLGEMKRRTVLHYGLPDFVHLSPKSRADAKILTKYIIDTIESHEPRLRVKSITVDSPRPYRDAITAIISGFIEKENLIKKTVKFPVYVGLAS